MERTLEFVWIGGLDSTREVTHLRSVNVKSRWRPVFVFAKPPQAKRSAWIEFIHEQDNKEKSWHPWQQSLGSVEHWLPGVSSSG